MSQTDTYTERYSGRCRCGHTVEFETELPVSANSKAGLYVRCGESQDITWVTKQYE